MIFLSYVTKKSLKKNRNTYHNMHFAKKLPKKYSVHISGYIPTISIHTHLLHHLSSKVKSGLGKEELGGVSGLGDN